MGIGKRGREHKGRAGTTLASRAHQGTFQRTQVAAGEREGGRRGRSGGSYPQGSAEKGARNLKIGGLSTGWRNPYGRGGGPFLS